MSFDFSDFEIDVIEKSYTVPVIVDFWAPWCHPCRILGPLLEKLAKKHESEWVLIKVNVDDNQDISIKYSVTGIPAVKLFIEGTVVDEFTGALPEAAIEQWLKKAIPSETEKKIQEARELIHQNQSELAEAILNDLLFLEPHNKDAQLLLAQVYIYTDPQRTFDLLTSFTIADPGYELADSLRSFAHLFIQSQNPENIPDSQAKSHCLTAIAYLKKQDFDHALEEFIQSLKKDRTFNSECAKKSCIAIFKILGEEHPLTKKHRRAFGAALYI